MSTTPFLGLLGVDGVDDEQTTLDVSDNDVGPDRDTRFGVQRDGEPLLPPSPDPPGVVRAVDGLGHQCRVSDHALNAAQHRPNSISGR